MIKRAAYTMWRGRRSRGERGGFTLIETLVATALLAMVLLGPVTFLANGFTRTGVSEDRLTALYLAEEGLELVRHIRDNNILAEQTWNQGLDDGAYEIDYNSGLTPYASPGTPILFDSATGVYSYDTGTATKFIRKITLSNVATDKLDVTVDVTWSDRAGSRSVELRQMFYNWL